MIWRNTPIAVLTGAFALALGIGCNGGDSNPLSSVSASDLDTATEAAATIQANGIDAELLSLAEDVEVATPDDPTQRPRPRFERLQAALGLTDEQVAQIEAIVTSARQALRAIREQVRAGTLTREAAREQIRALHEEKKTEIEAVLTDEQRAQWEALRAEHGRQFNRPPLARFLDLTEEQVTQFRNIMEETWGQIQDLRQQVEAGTLTRDEARAQLRTLRERERDQLSEVLTEAQRVRFNRMLRHARFGFGPRGFGHGPRGDTEPPGEA